MKLLFGYVKINKPELKIGDYEVYKGVYCSLCKELGHSFGILSRFTLSYDFTFLALIKMALTNECVKFEKSRCSFNPFHKCKCCGRENKSVKFSASVAIIMLYYKVKDNIDDSGFFKKILMYLLLPLVIIYFNKAKKLYPDIDEILFNAIEQQKKLEKEKCSSIDAAASPTANALGEIFAYGEQDEEQARVLKHLGFCIGRYVYIMDAVDDLPDDFKKGQYNTFIFSDKITSIDDVKEAREKASVIIDRTIVEAINTYGLLKLSRFHNILDNIVLEGMSKEKQRMLEKEVEL